MSYSKNFRLPLLAVTLGSALLVLTKVTLYSTASRYAVSPFTFFPTVPLPGWQLLSSTPLATQKEHLEYLSGRSYQYTHASVPLAIEMRYLNNTSGEVKDLVESYTSVPTSGKLRHQKGIGFYSVFTYQQKAYLSSCINPRGGSTVTQRQFNQNRHTYDVQINRLLPWLLGQEKLEDKRCLWTQLSIPVKNSSSEAFRVLESAWFDWYQWWYPRFPKS